MKKGIFAIFAMLVAMAAMMGSCGTSKKATGESGSLQPDAPVQRFNDVVATYNDWTTMKTNGKVTIGGKSPFTSSMQITMVRGKSVNVSLRPLLGIEMGRIYITGDSIIIVNKVERYYIAEKLSLITGGIPVNITDMQNLLLARMFEFGNGTITAKPATLQAITQGTGDRINVTLRALDTKFTYTFSVDSELALRALSLEADGKPLGLNLIYSEHQSTPIGKLAGNVQFMSKLGGQDMSLQFTFDPMIVWNQPISERSPIDTRYRRVDGMELLKGMFK